MTVTVYCTLLYIIIIVDRPVGSNSMYNFSYVPAERKWLKVREQLLVYMTVIRLVKQFL